MGLMEKLATLRPEGLCTHTRLPGTLLLGSCGVTASTCQHSYLAPQKVLGAAPLLSVSRFHYPVYYFHLKSFLANDSLFPPWVLPQSSMQVFRSLLQNGDMGQVGVC